MSRITVHYLTPDSRIRRVWRNGLVLAMRERPIYGADSRPTWVIQGRPWTESDNAA